MAHKSFKTSSIQKNTILILIGPILSNQKNPLLINASENDHFTLNFLEIII